MKQLNQSGQTLIALLIFMLVAMTVTIAATAIAIINLQGNTSFANGQLALQNAQSGVENAVLSLERNPSYTGGTIPLASGTDTITVSGSGTLTIVSVGTDGNFSRTLTATATDTSDIISITNWSETP
jgi:hypothetical protein